MVKKYILGISAYYHDSAAALICNGEILCAAQEERFTRIKNDSSFPIEAISFCLEFSKITLDDIDKIIFYDKPFLKFERILETHLNVAPFGLKSFLGSMPDWLGRKINFKKMITKELSDRFKLNYNKANILFSAHHLSHAASSFYTSPFADAACLTIDGVGEWSTLSLSHFSTDKAEFLKEMHFPNSIGLYYSAFTYFCGFKVNSGEYKLMGLAPFGIETNERYQFYKDKIKSDLIEIFDDGSIQLNMKYFNFDRKLSMFDLKKVESLLKLKRRVPEEGITQDFCDLALAVQHVLEEIVLKLCKYAKDLTGSENLCLAGGVALNCVANAKIRDHKIFKNIWIHPAAGDAGGALGAALAYHYTSNSYSPIKEFSPYLGPSFTDEQCEQALKELDQSYTFYDDEKLFDHVAKEISESKVIGWFQGRVEWGPRALGNRSIIADARDTEMQQVLNLKIKYRESFRPFAPIILEEKAGDFFENCNESRYMLFTHQVKSHLLEKPSDINDETPEERVKQKRSSIPSITHMDNSARVQTVPDKLNPRLYKLLKAFNTRTNSPVLINTSFNVRGEPIVCSPKDAINCFLNTEMDVLVLNNFVITKHKDQN